jgi:hypothetical protein
MTTLKNLVSTLAALAAGTTLFAQTEPTVPVTDDAGVLGHRYVEAGFGFIDVNKSSVDAFGTGLTVNLPVAPSIDVSMDYLYSWAEGHRSEFDAHDLSVSGTYWIQAEQNLKTFARVSLGYNWNDYDDSATWGAEFGAQYTIRPNIAVTISGGYDDDFDKGNDSGSFNGTVTGHYWFTKQVAAFASASWIEGGNFGFAGGVTVKF